MFTLEKAALATLYHALLKPPKSLQSASAGNYMVARERRRLALEEKMSKQELVIHIKDKLRAEWLRDKNGSVKR